MEGTREDLTGTIHPHDHPRVASAAHCHSLFFELSNVTTVPSQTSLLGTRKHLTAVAAARVIGLTQNRLVIRLVIQLLIRLVIGVAI